MLPVIYIILWIIWGGGFTAYMNKNKDNRHLWDIYSSIGTRNWGAGAIFLFMSGLALPFVVLPAIAVYFLFMKYFK